MSEYTYTCEDCGCTFTFPEHRVAPFKEAHYIVEEDGEVILECDGDFYRNWHPTKHTMKGKGYEEQGAIYD